MSADRKRDIRRRNKALERAGKKSRYIDDDPDNDWSYIDDLKAKANEDTSWMDKLPPINVMKRAAIEEEKTRRMLQDRVERFAKKKIPTNRIEALKKIIQFRKSIGFSTDVHEEELARLEGVDE